MDKTAWLYALACRQEKFLLTRPRRFGKSSLVSTLASLFGEGLKDFSGLAIESLWQDKTYAVVTLDFSDLSSFDTFDVFREQLHERLTQAFAPHGFAWEAASGRRFFSQLSAWLRKQPAASLVLLVDDYDAPLRACLGDPERFKRVSRELASFYAEVKSHDAAFRFVFLTGVTKLGQTGLFASGLNDVTDISLDPAYGALLGFTREELKAYFGALLRQAQKTLGLSEDALLEAMARHFGGYCFDREASTTVFHPWAVMNFLQAPDAGLGNEWLRTGGWMAEWREYFKTQAKKNSALLNEGQVISEAVLSASADGKTVSDKALLTQAGGFTIKKVQSGGFELGCPNDDVVASMAAFHSEWLDGRGPDDAEALARGRLDAVAAEFNRRLEALDDERSLVTDEAVGRALQQVLRRGSKHSGAIKVHNAFERPELAVEAGSCRWVFEGKFRPKEESAQEAGAKLLAEACEQVSSRCGGERTARGEERFRAVRVLSEAKRQLVGWRLV